jgi:hypothetical protein
MSFLAKLIPAKAPITSAAIRAQIASAEAEITANHAKLGGIMANVAVMNDEQHQAAEAHIATIRRAITRLEAARKLLDEELPRVIAAEEAAAKAAADAALRQRAEAARKANTVEAKKLLTEYDKLAAAMGDVFARLSEINVEHDAVRAALKDAGIVGEELPHWSGVHRKHPDRLASKRREMRHVWVHEDGTTSEASLDENGNARLVAPSIDRLTGRQLGSRLERREVVVSRTYFRPGHHENPLLQLALPPAFAGGEAHWPRKS